MTHEIIIAGFGGQGVLLMGQLITYAGMIEGKNVSWLPSYGPEMRGGTTNCCVIVSDGPVGSPVVTEADTVIVFNRPSLDKFESYLKPGGNLFINSSLIDKKASRDDVKPFYITANDAAMGLGNAKVTNIIMLGAFIAATGIIKKESIMKAVEKTFGEKKANLIAVNEQAFDEGVKLFKGI
jgi:2-oxoglutarate ferredoxin oxidoreductase subunit gamma